MPIRCQKILLHYRHNNSFNVSLSLQLAQFRKMFETTDDSKPLTLNYRPVQPLNGRIVKSRTVDKSFITLAAPKWNHNSKKYGKLNN